MTAENGNNLLATAEQVSIGKIPEDGQVTVKDTGWSEHDKERMQAYGFDGVDMVEAWYS